MQKTSLITINSKKFHLKVPVLIFAFILVLIQSPTLAFLGILFFVFLIALYRVGQFRLFFSTTLFVWLLIGYGIEPFLFYFNRDMYTTQPGFSYIGTFEFSPTEFASVFSELLIIILGTLATLLACNKFFFKDRLYPSIPNVLNSGLAIFRAQINRESNRVASRLPLFVVFGVIPLNILMYTLRVGVSSVEPPFLPFHLSGMMFYFRNYIVPIILIHLYLRSKIHILNEFSIIIYLVVLGVTSLSRGAIAIMFLPYLLISFSEKRYKIFAIQSFIFVFVYQFITVMRDYLWLFSPGGIEFIVGALEGYSFDDFNNNLNILRIISSAISRFSSTQSLVLAFQQQLPNQFKNMVDLFQHNRDFLDTYIFKEMYGLTPIPGVPIGVGIGLFGLFLLISSHHPLYLLFFGVLLGIILVILDLMYLFIIQKKSMLKYGIFPIGIISLLYLFEGTLDKFYFCYAIQVLLCVLVQWHEKKFIISMNS